MRNLGERIKSLRAEQHMTLPALSDSSGLSKGLLSKLENNFKSNPSIDTLFKLAEGLNVTLADILETEQAQIKRVVPENKPEWLDGLVKMLGKDPDPSILDAMYVLQNRKADAPQDPKHWEFVYKSLENSFR